ncbi:MAG: methyltransferase domain-containing protein [Bacteroidota bacterium]
MADTPHILIDLGCGKRKRPGTIGIDRNSQSDADVLHDLNHYPYPFPDNYCDGIYSDNVLEHLDDVIGVMVELHRITKTGGFIEITVPFYAHRNANTDPTHKHWFGVHSFDYFVEGTDHSNFHYSPVRFRLDAVVFDQGIRQTHWIDRMITKFANAKKDFFENRLANIFPRAQLTFRFTVVK